jgi:hypothetical protein
MPFRVGCASHAFCAKICRCSRTRWLHAGWYNTGKLHGSLKVIRCDSRGKKSIDKVSKPSWFVVSLRDHSLSGGVGRDADRQSAAEQVVSCQCVGAAMVPGQLSKPERTFCTVFARCRPGSSRQCGVAATRGRSHPCWGSSPSFPRSSRCLWHFQRWIQLQAAAMRKRGRRRTGNVLVENVIFLDDIVDDLFRVFIDDKDLPLSPGKTGWLAVAYGRRAAGVQGGRAALRRLG